jgi:hypothetical protein
MKQGLKYCFFCDWCEFTSDGDGYCLNKQSRRYNQRMIKPIRTESCEKYLRGKNEEAK